MSEQPNQESEKNINISDSILDSVQFGGIAGRDLKSIQIQGDVKVVNVYDTVQVPPAPFGVAKPLSREEFRWRQVLLSKVQQFWIDGVLANSLHKQVLIELGLEERNDYVPNPLAGVEEFPEDPRQVLSMGTSAANVFEDIGAGRTLLILGKPGAGKTVMLLKLAESLINRTEKDLSQPLPVVVNLSSWAKQRKSIDEWLVQELLDTYTVSKVLGKAWIDKAELILLLDGLDEVEAKHRNACVQALNQFIQTHGRTEMVVCSRIYDYEALDNRLSLRNAIYVQPLTPHHIDKYLEQAGESLVTLRLILNQNSEIKEFASSPLILSIMSLAYQNSDWEDLPQSVTSEAFQQSLFDTYIKRMFQRRGNTQYYNPEQATLWLIWLAQEMLQKSQTVFFIGRMRSNCLRTRLQRIKYQWASWLMGGLIYGLIHGLYFGLMDGSRSRLTLLMLSGLSGGGAAYFRHLTLRVILQGMGYIPWNYARFLEYAIERLFLQKVGGGYIFIHRMLLEHFAQMKLEPLQSNNLHLK